VRAQALGGEFAATEPGVCADHAVVTEHVYAREANGNFTGRLRVRVLLVYGGDDELEETADDEAGHEQDAAVAKADDDEGVCDKCEDGDCGEDVGHGEGVGDFGHLKKISFESCSKVLLVVHSTLVYGERRTYR
jgi:hypothetical protein